VHLGLGISLAAHGVMLAWALLTIQATPAFKMPELTPVEVAIISADDMVRLTKGDRTAKNLDATGNEGTAKKEPLKQVKTPPPPPPVAAAPPPPPPEPEKAPEPKPPDPVVPEVKPEPKPDPLAQQMAALEQEPVKPAVPVGPSPEEKQKLEDAIKAADDKAAADLALKTAAEEAVKAKAAADAKRAADAKKAAEAKKVADAKKAADAKKLADAAKAKADADAKAKQFNADDILKKIAAADDGGPKQALDNKAKPVPQPVGGAKGPVTPTKGPRAGAPEGTDTQLTAGQKSRLVAILKAQIERCWNINAGLTDAARLIPVFEFELNRDGTLRGEPKLTNPENSQQFQDAANSALRALKGCAPYRDLPPDMYEHWEYSRFRFDPSQMFR
jgi:colicin import membrane protein